MGRGPPPFPHGGRQDLRDLEVAGGARVMGRASPGGWRCASHSFGFWRAHCPWLDCAPAHSFWLTRAALFYSPGTRKRGHSRKWKRVLN